VKFFYNNTIIPEAQEAGASAPTLNDEWPNLFNGS